MSENRRTFVDLFCAHLCYSRAQFIIVYHRHIEGLWDILKQERYYGKQFNNRESLVQMIEE